MLNMNCSGKIFLWLEDRKGKSSYIFWSTMTKHLIPSVTVESKKNSSELVKAVKQLKDEENQYIIVLDHSFDNLQIYKEQKILKKCAEIKKNVHLLDLICFEYILLEFDQLISWIYAPNDEFLTKRSEAIKARNKLVETLQSGNMNYKAMQEVIEYDKYLDHHNIEQLSAKLLFDLTRNTGFEVSKGTIGDCWIKSCCEWMKRQDNDMCGLDYRRLSLKDKMWSIYTGTSLNREFAGMGLEVLR